MTDYLLLALSNLMDIRIITSSCVAAISPSNERCDFISDF